LVKEQSGIGLPERLYPQCDVLLLAIAVWAGGTIANLAWFVSQTFPRKVVCNLVDLAVL